MVLWAMTAARPHAADGNFCKHCVAVGLAWLAGRTEGERPRGRSGRAKQRDPWRDIERFLAKQPPAALIELLLDVARRDDPLYQRLLLKANQVRGGSSVVTAFRRAIDDATQVDGFVGWREARTFAEGIRQVADSLDACSASKRRCPSACAVSMAATYAKALGKVGLQRYRELAEAEWSKVTLRNDENGYDAHRAAIARVMERLAEAGGDVDELVAIKAKDLSSGYRYLAIAEVLTKAGRANEALAWAERGLKAFPDRPDDRLRDFLVSAYLKRRRNVEALQLTWAQFEERTGLEGFIRLHRIAGKLGAWPEQRERALTAHRQPRRARSRDDNTRETESFAAGPFAEGIDSLVGGGLRHCVDRRPAGPVRSASADCAGSQARVVAPERRHQPLSSRGAHPCRGDQ